MTFSTCAASIAAGAVSSSYALINMSPTSCRSMPAPSSRHSSTASWWVKCWTRQTATTTVENEEHWSRAYIGCPGRSEAWIPRHCAKRSRKTLLPRIVTFPAAVVVTLWCVACAPMADAWATPLERVEFEGASQRLVSGGLIRGDRIQGYLAKPEGAGPFPAVIGLHGCAGMFDMTKRKLVDELVGWGYVVLLVDSFATRDIERACTGGFPLIGDMRRSDAYGALAFLARQTFVDPQRVAAVGFSQGGWVALLVAEADSFELFVRTSNLRFRAVVAFYPLCKPVVGRLVIPALILTGALDDWTP